MINDCHPMVLVGKNDWLFLNKDANCVIDQILGKYVLPRDFYQSYVNLFDFRKYKASEIGYRYFFGIIPNKECVYSEFLPDEIRLSDQRPVFDVLKAASGRVECSYYLDWLVSAARKREIYIKGDTHWNHIGALEAFNFLMISLGLPGIDDDEFIETAEIIDGDLTSKINSYTKTTVLRPAKREFQLVDRNNVLNIGQRRVYENKCKTLPRAVLFRDSFSSHQLEMFASRFSRVVCVWQPNIDYELVKREAPDFVISQQVERFLVACPDDQHGLTHGEYELQKLVKNID